MCHFCFVFDFIYIICFFVQTPYPKICGKWRGKWFKPLKWLRKTLFVNWLPAWNVCLDTFIDVLLYSFVNTPENDRLSKDKV